MSNYLTPYVDIWELQCPQFCKWPTGPTKAPYPSSMDTLQWKSLVNTKLQSQILWSTIHTELCLKIFQNSRKSRWF